MRTRPLSHLTAVAFATALTLPQHLAAQEKPHASVSIHGYLTQGLGYSDKYPTFGLTKDGTADYRRAAILVRYEATPANRFVVQLAHRRLGDSPAMLFEDNVKVDMAFFEHRFGASSVRVGKTAMPFGIYNEFRYAGNLLPFYRAPISVYWEGTYTNETMDGVVLEHHFRAGEPWELTAELFGGSYSVLEFGTVPTGPSTSIYTGAPLQSKGALGGQLWLNTPVEGLRLGFHGRYHTDVGGLYPRGEGAATREYLASVDGSFEKWQLRVEGERTTSLGVKLLSRYGQLGFRPIERVSFNLQAETTELETGPAGARSTFKFWQDQAAGLNFYLAPLMVLKLEAHASSGYLYEQPTDFAAPMLSGKYFITSFSVSF
jgi:hypothetical protein